MLEKKMGVSVPRVAESADVNKQLPRLLRFLIIVPCAGAARALY